MKIVKVSYSALVNLGDYQNERIGMFAYLEGNDSPEEVIQELKRRVIPLCGVRLQQLKDQEWELRRAIVEAENKLREYETYWNAAADFLKAQGINPDAPRFPQFTNLLPSINLESKKVAEGELDEDDQDDCDQY